MQKKSNLIQKFTTTKDLITKPISNATMYGVPLGVGASIVNANDLGSSISDSISGKGKLEDVLLNPKLGEGIRDTIGKISSSYIESKFNTFPEIIMDSTAIGGAVLASGAGLIGYEGYKKFKELRNTKKRDRSASKKITDGLKTAYHTTSFGVILPLQIRLGHTVANSIEGVDIWNSLVKPAATYITNL